MPDERGHATLEEVLKLIAYLRETEGDGFYIRTYPFGPHGPPYTIEHEGAWGEAPKPGRWQR